MKHEIKIENCLYNIDNVANERTAVCVLFTSYLYCKLGRQHTLAPLVAAISLFMSLTSVIGKVTTVVVVDHTTGETSLLFSSSSVGSFMSPCPSKFGNKGRMKETGKQLGVIAQ